jgi:hypothetical protein
VKATHINYMHPRHLRVVNDDGTVVCMSPSHSQYERLKNTRGLRDCRTHPPMKETN